MNTLHLMVGLPRSGKSTEAKNLGFPIVEPDAIRLALHGTPWRPEAEPMIWAIAKIMVRSLFLSGHTDVVLDATNHTADNRREWESDEWCIKLHVVDTPVDVCVSRAIATDQEYLIPVIERMSRDWVPPGGKLDW